MTGIRLYNTKTRAVEPLEPTVTPGRVGMYVCGPTVYDRAHLGNARPVLVFDVLFRLLRHVYGPQNVTYVRNFTDVDDKIIDRAAETGRPIGQITEETTRWYLEDMAALGALEPTGMPRATAYIPEMVAMIDRLIARGHAYAAQGHVLFDVRSYADYGRLSGRSVDDMIAGARVEVAPYKRDPMDFVLWKPSSDDLPGWDSPWGRGRPGWHIECSAMSLSLLGESFDIHGGGIDLQFPHHENEIAQSKCAHPEGAFARIWMHNEMLQVEGRKMSKSLGNFFTVRDLLDQGYPGEVIRFVMLSTHYRKPMDWTERKAEEAERTLRKWRTLCQGLKPSGRSKPDDKVSEALGEDLNTPKAIARLHELANQGNGQALLVSASTMGLLSEELGGWFVFGEKQLLDDARVQRLVELRWKAKAGGDFAFADLIRERLSDLGIWIRDYRNTYAFDRSVGHQLAHHQTKVWDAWNSGNVKRARELAARARELGLPLHVSEEGPDAVTMDRTMESLHEPYERELEKLAEELDANR